MPKLATYVLERPVKITHSKSIDNILIKQSSQPSFTSCFLPIELSVDLISFNLAELLFLIALYCQRLQTPFD